MEKPLQLEINQAEHINNSEKKIKIRTKKSFLFFFYCFFFPRGHTKNLYILPDYHYKFVN